MKNHELLDMIGGVNEGYVQAADDNVARPRFRWKTLAACAACAALVLGAYPVYRALNPPLHSYTVMKGGAALTTQDDIKAPVGDLGGGLGPGDGEAGPGATAAGAADVSDLPKYVESGEEDLGSDIDGAHYNLPGQDIPVQERAAAQYESFLKNSGLAGSADWLPEWCGGLWIDNDYYPEAKLTVAVVDGFRTPELEAQIQDWCGGEVAFKDVKYSWSHLDQLMQPVSEAFDGRVPDGACFGFGVDVMENRLTVDVYGGEITNDVLAELARLDPDGDAILVRLFPDALTAIDDDAKGPAPGLAEPSAVDPDARETPTPTPIDGSTPAPGGVTQPAVNELPKAKENSMPTYQENTQPAQYDVQPAKIVGLLGDDVTCEAE